MSDLYAMQRANGDWFAIDNHGRFRVPLFHSSHDAMTARLRNWEMLLFKPVALDARLLKEIIPLGGGTDVDLWLVKDPLLSLKRGCLVEHAQLVLLMRNSDEEQNVLRNGNTFHVRETWEDEGGKYAKCA
jgi:hypothetical protein